MSVDPHYVLQSGVGPVGDLADELDQMRDILLERDPYPIDSGLLTQMEVATVFFARAKEMEQLILRAEREGRVLRNQEPYKFRTGELRSFIETAKAFMEVGSRRVTNARYELELLRESV